MEQIKRICYEREHNKLRKAQLNYMGLSITPFQMNCLVLPNAFFAFGLHQTPSFENLRRGFNGFNGF